MVQTHHGKEPSPGILLVQQPKEDVFDQLHTRFHFAFLITSAASAIVTVPIMVG